MVHEVVVVGGGIGGLTVAALLTARGIDVCLLERGSQLGGVIAPVEAFGYTFDPGVGIYPCWETGGIHDRVFSELSVVRPEVQPEPTAYVVRLPEGIDVPLSSDDDQFYCTLRSAFPETADVAISFYRECSSVVDDPRSTNSPARSHPVSAHLANASPRFRQFIDAQLQLLTQSSSDTCDFVHAAIVLTTPRKTTCSIKGGAAAIANSLADAVRQGGGRIRLNSPVLRLSYDSLGQATGVDLLTGETLGASLAIVSNLTVWDTFGKLIGLNRTPAEIRKALGSMKGYGAYMAYVGIDDAALSNLPSERILAVGEALHGFAPDSQLMLAMSPAWDSRAPDGKRAATILTYTDVDEWFIFHESTEDLESQEQEKLEEVWQRLHSHFPELGDRVELIETSNPLDCYETQRRKLGMIGRPNQFPSPLLSAALTSLDNVFMVGDTTAEGFGIAGVTKAATSLANRITKSLKN